jgi:chromosome segregation ATPase
LVLVAIGCAYDLLRRESTLVRRKDYERLREDHTHLSATVEGNREAHDDNCRVYARWREEVDQRQEKLAEQRLEVRAELGDLKRMQERMCKGLDDVEKQLRTLGLGQSSADLRFDEQCKANAAQTQAQRDAYGLLAGELQAWGKHHAELREEFDGVCSQWRQKVLELDARQQALDTKTERVLIDARNELAGDLAKVTNNGNSKGWRE